MTIKEFYDVVDGNYEEALLRFKTDDRILRFIKIFCEEPSLNELKNAIESKDWELAFRTAHTIKGTTANMSFTDLQKRASDLTEALRPRTPLEDASLYDDVEVAYKLVLDKAKELN